MTRPGGVFVKGPRVIASDFDFTGFAAVLTAVALVIGSVAAAIATIRNTAKIADTHEMTAHIDRAVNGKREGEAPLVEQVQSITDRHAADDDLNGVAATLRRIEALLTEKEGAA